MQNNKSSVMDNLYKIGDKISVASTGKDGTASDSPVSTEGRSLMPEHNTIFNKALLRRYEDLLRTKRDLTGRLVAECESLRCSQERANAVMEITTSTLKQLEEYLNIVRNTENNVNPENQTELAKECRKIENIRIEVIRLQARMKKLADTDSAVGSMASSNGNVLSDFDSLTFSQLFRFGWSLFLPLILASVLGAILIGAAIILSYNGVFLWR
ncbi:MAG: hypothetical protein IKB16_07730 [Lentisphaeria bacterium]|nr:hypothetical protein [Lentisphaeria bacterium]